MIPYDLPRPEAARRAQVAREQLRACRWCAWDCATDRTTAEGVARSRCRAGAGARVFWQDVEWAGEAELVPTAVVSFSGCNWRCRFCLTGADSQDAAAGLPADPPAIAARIRAKSGLRSLTILGGEPTIHLHAALELIAGIPPGLPVVWKTNASAAPAARELLAGQVQVVLADAKFGPGGCARRLAGVDHPDVLRDNLRWARDHARLIVRHLLMPGHLACCTRPVIAMLAEEFPGVPLSLMTGFLPVFRASAMGGNHGPEIAAARELAIAAGVPLVPWSLGDGQGVSPRTTDEIHIDPQGRVCVDSATPELLAALHRLQGEFMLES